MSAWRGSSDSFALTSWPPRTRGVAGSEILTIFPFSTRLPLAARKTSCQGTISPFWARREVGGLMLAIIGRFLLDKVLKALALPPALAQDDAGDQLVIRHILPHSPRDPLVPIPRIFVRRRLVLEVPRRIPRDLAELR